MNAHAQLQPTAVNNTQEIPFPRGQSRYYKMHLDMLAELPHPSIVWAAHDLDLNLKDVDLSRDVITLHERNIIAREKYVSRHEVEDYNHDFSTWRVTKRAHKLITQLLDKRGPTLPCPGTERGHKSGIRTIEPGRYECKACGHIHDRATVEEVYG